MRHYEHEHWRLAAMLPAGPGCRRMEENAAVWERLARDAADAWTRAEVR
jgi:hypothetical protein